MAFGARHFGPERAETWGHHQVVSIEGMKARQVIRALAEDLRSRGGNPEQIVANVERNWLDTEIQAVVESSKSKTDTSGAKVLYLFDKH